jgi:hypothetical protein
MMAFKERIADIEDQAERGSDSELRLLYCIVLALGEVARQIERIATDYEIANSMFPPAEKRWRGPRCFE